MMEKPKTFDPDYFRLISFVPSSSTGKSEEKNKLSGKKSKPDCQVSGSDIKAFYEDLVKKSSNDVKNASENSVLCGHEESAKNRKPKRPRLKKYEATRQSSKEMKVKDMPDFKQKQDKKTFTGQRMFYKFLQSAQTGDSESFLELLNSGVDVNHADFYGWTALMCAAHAGQMDTVMLCLEHDANKTKANNDGQTAYDLAKTAGFADIASAIHKYNTGMDSKMLPSCLSEKTEETFFCEICRFEFSSSEKPSHFSSTVHLFNAGHKPSSASYLIPESNRGFQMLVHTGWNSERGLGPQGEGQKYPVKTVLKRDRTGFGAEGSRKPTAKVTHFDPGDKQAIDRTFKQLGARKSALHSAKSVIKAKEKRDKILERALRYEFADYY